MADFDPDAYLAAAAPTPFNPDEYLQAVGKPSPTTAPQTFAPGSPREIAREQLAGQPVVQQQMERAGRAVADTATGFVKGLPSMLKFIKPPTLTDVLTGAAETLGQVKQARESPIGSQEWWNAVVPLASQYAMQVGALRVGAPKLTESLFGKEKPPVQPLAAETAATKEVIKNATQERQVQESVLAERARDDARGTPAAPSVSGGVRPTAEGAAPQAEQVSTVPQPEQPRIISTAVQSGDTIVRGEGFEPHDSIAARVAAERPSPTQETGKVTHFDPNDKIVGVAIKKENGEIVVGVNHPDARIKTEGGYAPGVVDGFVTASGKFLDRKQSLGQAMASHQLPKSIIEGIQKSKDPELYLEDTNANFEQQVKKFAKGLEASTFREANEQAKTQERSQAGASKTTQITGKEVSDLRTRRPTESLLVRSDAGVASPVSAAGEAPVATPQGIQENQKGFIIREPDGTERFTNDRSEAARVANAAGQVKPENAGTTELHSQQLVAHPLEGQTYYRGTNPNRVSGEDQFYSAHRETAEEYAAGGPGGVEGNVEQVKGESLPRNLYKAFNKEELAKTLGIRSDIYGKKFDNIVKQKLQSQGYAGVQYELGTALGDLSSPGETEIHVFSRKAQPVSEAGQTPAVSTLPEQVPQIPEGAKVNVKLRTNTGEMREARGMDAREAEGIFTKEKSSYQALLNCLGGA